MNQNWFLIYTKPRCEDRVSFKLLNAGFDVLNSKLKERKFIRRKLQDAVSPLFPCYIFARFDCSRDLGLIRYTIGVRDVVGSEGAPTPLPERVVDELRERMANGYITITPRTFDPGEELIIKSGSLEGFHAVFVKELKGTERVSILLKTLNARAIVEVAVLERV